jgi:hypothetical protein
MKKFALATVIVVLLPLSPALGHRTATQEMEGQVRVNDQVAPVGHTVAQGRRDGTRCTFKGGLHVDQVSDGLTDWVAIRVDDSCAVSLEANWSGQLVDAPAGILPDSESEEWAEESFTEEALLETEEIRLAGLGTITAAATCTTHQAQRIMYGYGGPTDRLTRLVGKMVACESSTSWTSVSATGTCYATDPPGSWKWVIEKCYSGGITTSSTVAQAIQFGDYHCSPRTTAPCSATNPDGYDHTMKMVERKTRGGSATCTGSLTGLDVVASYTDIIQGCK